MRKRLFFLTLLAAISFATVSAQNYALIDMEYILGEIPAYRQATTQIDNASKQWQSEIEKISKEAQSMYQTFQKKVATLTDAQRAKQEEDIIAKEKQAADLRRKYFGPEGELSKKQTALIKPIEDQIYEAVKQIATRYGYAMVLDRASAQSIVFASPDIDISNDVLQSMGY